MHAFIRCTQQKNSTSFSLVSLGELCQITDCNYGTAGMIYLSSKVDIYQEAMDYCSELITHFDQYDIPYCHFGICDIDI